MENKNDTSLFTRFRNSRTIDKDDPTLKIGQIYTSPTGEVERLYNQHHGKNYWMKGKGVNGRNGRCNSQFRADWNGFLIPSESVAFGKFAQTMSSPILREYVKHSVAELNGRI
jgi:hypothetical protein